ncbi:MAG: hypothetical protein BGO54_07800 [Sphingobacteriales bacterium 46-32]|nr:MAG: hypothetical protein BGO54_07800 [Sphingobacteriales bacterium 46-32]
MSRVVISWLAFHKDFDKVGNGFQINSSGPTLTIHKLFKKNGYELHYLLQCVPKKKGDELDKKVNAMKNYLSENYSKHKVEIELLDIDEDELSNYEMVAAHLRSFLNKIDVNDDVEVITGTGSSIMHMVWVALFYSIDLKFKLFLIHHDPIRFPDFIPVPLIKSKMLDQKLREFHIKDTFPKDIIRDLHTDAVYKKAKIWADAIQQNILILGETGTGKDVLANYIHNNSPLADKPFAAINCASLPEDNLLYSELFGHEKNAFTGATKKRDGLFAICNGGTLFMDEIGDMPMRTQLSLLRAIENKEIKPLGSDSVVKNVKVRIIAATNADLWEKCVTKEFRWDLYYRLCDCELELKSLRDRGISEKSKIIVSIIKQSELQWGRKLNFSPDAEIAFYNHPYPGNFRELKRTIDSLFASQLKNIEVSDLPKRFFKSEKTDITSLQENEKQYIQKIYANSNYVMKKTAEKLGYSNQHKLRQKMENLGIRIINKRK